MYRFEVPPNPTRGYLDPATIEQHRMIGQVRGYNKAFNRPLQERSKVSETWASKTKSQKNNTHYFFEYIKALLKYEEL